MFLGLQVRVNEKQGAKRDLKTTLMRQNNLDDVSHMKTGRTRNEKTSPPSRASNSEFKTKMKQTTKMNARTRTTIDILDHAISKRLRAGSIFFQTGSAEQQKTTKLTKQNENVQNADAHKELAVTNYQTKNDECPTWKKKEFM